MPGMVIVISEIRVLIVDNDSMIGDILKVLIETVDGLIVVGIANTQYDIFDQIDRIKPDLVILDDNFSDCKSIEVISFVRNKELPIDFMMVTPSSKDISIDLFLRFGIIDYIIKPFEVQRITASLVAYRGYRNQLTYKKNLCQAELDAWWPIPKLSVYS